MWEEEGKPISFCRANEADQVEKWNADVCGTRQSCTAECSQSSVSPSWARRDRLGWLVEKFFLRSSYLESQRSETYPSDSSAHRWLKCDDATCPLRKAIIHCCSLWLSVSCFDVLCRDVLCSVVLSSRIIFCSLLPPFVIFPPFFHLHPCLICWSIPEPVFFSYYFQFVVCFPDISPVFPVFVVFLPVFPVLLWFVLYLVFVSFVLSWICACQLLLFCCQLFCWVPFVYCI